MRQLSATRHMNRAGVVSLELFESGVSTGLRASGALTTKSSCSRAARDNFRGRVTDTEISAVVAKFFASQSPVDGVQEDLPADTAAAEPEVLPPLLFKLRYLTSPTPTIGNEDLTAMLRYPSDTDHIIEWGRDNIQRCAAVDVDWHDIPSRTDDSVFLGFIGSLTPAPLAGWVTRNRGMRLIYHCPRADLFAAVAAVRCAERFRDTGISGIEIKTDSRHPGEKHVRFCDPDTDLSRLWPRVTDTDEEVDGEAWTEWLQSRDLSFGRFPHDRCLISPHNESKSPTPVEIRPSGVMCHSCSGRTGRGFMSAAYLMRGEDTFRHLSPLATVVSNLTHYEHAAYILREHLPHEIDEKIMRLYYEALLYSWHGLDDSRVESAFRERNLIRFEGFWATRGGEMRDAAKVRVTLSNLPACRDETGEVNSERVEAFSDSIDLTNYGYPAIRPVFGHRIGTFHPGDEDSTRIPRIVVSTSQSRHKPEYIPAEKRMPRDEAWGHLSRVYPGIDVDLIEMLIYSRGLVERGTTSMHPKFLFDGVSGSGKSAHPHIAAAICGDRSTDIIAVKDDERLGQKIYEAMRVGSFANLDEIVKEAKKARVDIRTFLTFLLNLTPESSVHALYIGQVRFGWLPVMCLSDTDYPDDALGDEQLGRRLLYRHLGTEKVDWAASTRAAGLSHWADPRSANGDIRVACDAIMSHVIDRYFKGPPPDITDVAAEKGFKFLNADGEAERRKMLLRDLFLAWSKYVPTSQYPIVTGKKTFGINEDGDLSRLWSRVHDEGNPTSWGRMNERSWREATGHPYDLRGRVEPFRRGTASLVSIWFEERVNGGWRPVQEVSHASINI